MTANGENVDELIAVKMEQTGLDYEKASREVVAEALTDILPDANFVEELATKHKNIFQQLLAKLKEFLDDLRAYFNTIGHNSSAREAKALKEQVGDTVKYVESVVKLFDRVAVEAVENYQMTVATDIETNNTDGGIDNAGEAETGIGVQHRGAEAGISESYGGTREEDADRSRVSETVGEAVSGSQEVYDRLEDSDDDSWLTDEANYITPAEGSKLHNAQQAFANEYGIECYVIKASAWQRDALATTHGGKVYISESIEAEDLTTLVPHEGTHIMKQRGFQPYMEFIERTPESLIFTTDETDALFDEVSGHRKFDIFDMTEEQRTDFFDEFNSYVYGMWKSGIIENPEFDYGTVPNAFNDFDAYINDTDVVLGTSGLRHGLDRRFITNAPVTIKAGEILQNSIIVNEMTPAKKEAVSSYILIGAAINESGELYIVRSVINKFSSELTSMDVLYAINAKTEPDLGIKKGNQAGAYPQGSLSDDSYLTDSTISIAHLLEFVNRYFPDILPEGVLRHFGYEERPEGDLGENVLYQQRTDTLTDREVLQMAAEDINTDKWTEAERGALDIFQQLLAKLKEFLDDLRAYFNTIGHNSSAREAKALKEQVGDTVKYVESVVKLFDRVAVEAVENYQMTVATDTEINNTDGGITNVTERAEEGVDLQNRGTEAGISESYGGTREEDADRSRVSETVGEAVSGSQEVYDRLEDSDDDSWLTDEANYITPAQGSGLHNAKQTFAEGYGVECHVIKASAWKRDPVVSKILQIDEYNET